MNLTLQSTFDQVAQAIIEESQRRGYDRDGSIACLSTGIQESGLRPSVVDSTGHVGIYQQDGGYASRNDANGQLKGFFDRLDAKRKSAGASTDIWKNIFWLQQRPGEKSADTAFANGRKAYLTEIKSHIAQATDLYNRFAGGAAPVTNRPDFNEFALWTSNCKSRGGTKPTLFLLHTQEGGGGDSAAEDLARFCISTQGTADPVSYHDYVSQASDGGVTVVNGVDTDDASFSVGNANAQSINLCFAGSRAAWTRNEWMAQSKAIDVAAYLAVQDCKKYGISTKVVPPPYSTGTPGISDHRYVTDVIKWGSHTDVGPGFPWDYFAERVAFWLADGKETTPPVTTPPAEKRIPQDLTDRELLEQIWDQLRGPAGNGWPQLDGKSLVDYVGDRL